MPAASRNAAGDPTPFPMLIMIGTIAITPVNGEAAAIMKKAMSRTPKVFFLRPWSLPRSAKGCALLAACCWETLIALLPVILLWQRKMKRLSYTMLFERNNREIEGRCQEGNWHSDWSRQMDSGCSSGGIWYTIYLLQKQCQSNPCTNSPEGWQNLLARRSHLRACARGTSCPPHFELKPRCSARCARLVLTD
ncbi:hypothetical protein D3C85_1233810 [compost metagenome]